jgi:methylisocitrate lyase
MITASAGERFRDALKQPPLMIPGVFNALTARLAERAGFRAAYQSGAALSASLAALPDVGLINQTEFAQQGHYLVSAVSIPVISDADTGFGEALAVERTVTLFESAGLAGLHLEDQHLPKRCGHLSGKSLVSCAEMVSKLKAAVAARRDPSFVIIARTDGRASEGLEAAIDRAQAYVEAGADMIFPEALESPDEFGRFAGAIKVPLLANMTEFGKSPLLTATELGKLGYAAVLFPVTMLRVAAKAVEDALAQLAREGSQKGFLDRMQTRADLYKLLDYTGFESRDQAYFGR